MRWAETSLHTHSEVLQSSDTVDAEGEQNVERCSLLSKPRAIECYDYGYFV